MSDRDLSAATEAAARAWIGAKWATMPEWRRVGDRDLIRPVVEAVADTLAAEHEAVAADRNRLAAMVAADACPDPAAHEAGHLLAAVARVEVVARQAEAAGYHDAAKLLRTALDPEAGSAREAGGSDA